MVWLLVLLYYVSRIEPNGVDYIGKYYLVWAGGFPNLGGRAGKHFSISACQADRLTD